MNLKSIVAILLVAAGPAYAQAQKPDDAKVTKADAENLVKLISTDKAKTQIYCDLLKLGEQVEQADQKKDTKKVDELSNKMDELTDKLGPEYIALMDGLQDMDPNSKEGQDIGDALAALDNLCGK